MCWHGGDDWSRTSLLTMPDSQRDELWSWWSQAGMTSCNTSLEWLKVDLCLASASWGELETLSELRCSLDNIVHSDTSVRGSSSTFFLSPAAILRQVVRDWLHLKLWQLKVINVIHTMDVTKYITIYHHLIVWICLISVWTEMLNITSFCCCCHWARRYLWLLQLLGVREK